MAGPMDMKRMGLAASLAGGAVPPQGPQEMEDPQEEAPEMEILTQIMNTVQKISDQLDDLMGEQQPNPAPPPQGAPASGPGQQ